MDLSQVPEKDRQRMIQLLEDKQVHCMHKLPH